MEKERRTMGIELDYRDSELLRDPLRQEFLRGQASSVIRLLTNRFGPLPDSLHLALREGNEETLMSILDRASTAASLAEATGPDMARRLRL
jgi:hypothetical protein